MDVVLDYADGLFLNALYALPPFSTALAPHFAAPDSVPRQCFSLWLVVWLAGAAMYLAFATLSYVFLFDKSLERHPKFLKNQVRPTLPTRNFDIDFWFSFPGKSIH